MYIHDMRHLTKVTLSNQTKMKSDTEITTINKYLQWELWDAS